MSINDSQKQNRVSRRTLLATIGVGIMSTPLLAETATAIPIQGGEATYRGPAHTIIRAGDGVTETDHSYRLDVLVGFIPPKSPPGGVAETNPFGFHTGPGNPNEAGQSGHWEIHSAAISNDNIVFQYWGVNQVEENLFSAVLTDAHTQEALSANLINVDTALIPGRPQLGVLTLPKTMGVGTQLEGSVTEEQTSLRLSGATVDGFTSFESHIEAARVA